MNNMTSMELVDTYFELQELAEELEEPDEKLQNQMKEVETAIVKKAESLDYVILQKKKLSSVIDARIQVYRDEIQRLQQKKKTMERAWNRLKKLIIMLVKVQGEPNRSGNPQLRTSTGSFTVVSGYGPLQITDFNKIPSELMKVEFKPQIKEIRKRVIESEGETEYAVCPKVERLNVR